MKMKSKTRRTSIKGVTFISADGRLPDFALKLMEELDTARVGNVPGGARPPLIAEKHSSE